MSEFGGRLDAHLLKGSGVHASDEECPDCGEMLDVTGGRRRQGWWVQKQCPDCGWSWDDADGWEE